MIVPNNNNMLQNNYLVLNRYEIGRVDVNENEHKEMKTTHVVQKVEPLVYDKINKLNKHLSKLTERSIVPLKQENSSILNEKQLNETTATEATKLIEAIDQVLGSRETDQELESKESGKSMSSSESWTNHWLSSTSSYWNLGLWNWITSFLPNLRNYSTESLQATREELVKKAQG